MKYNYIFAAIFSTLFCNAQYGELDPTFGTGGKVMTTVGTTTSSARDVIILQNQKILAGGNSYSSATNDNFALACFNDDGSLDTSFGNQGTVESNYQNVTTTLISVYQLQNGKILAMGNAFYGGMTSDFLFVRYHPDGQIDTSFGNNGYKAMDFEGRADVPYKAVELPTGEILVVGESRSGPSKMIVAKYDSNMNLVTSFGTNGYYLFPETGSDARDIYVYPDGKYLVAGCDFTVNIFTDFAIWKFNADGTPDTAFGNNGIAKLDYFNYSDRIHSIRVQEDGKILAFGIAQNTTPVNSHNFAFARFNPDGSPDVTLNGTGKITYKYNNGATLPSDFELLDNGKIVASGITEGIDGFALLFLTPDLQPDPEYGAEGWVFTTFVGGVQNYAVTKQGSKIISCGGSSSASTGTVFALSRYLTETLATTDYESGQILLYPNPANEVIRVKIPNTDNATLQIYDVTGKNVKSFEVSQFMTSQEISINVSALSSGMYFLKVAGADFNSTVKFMKM